MSESLGSAVLDLTTDDSGLEQGFDQAEKTTESRMGSIAGTVGKGAKVAGAAVAGLGAAAVAGAFKVAKHGDELDKTSSKLGIHTDFLQDAHHWASQNGISAQSMERGVGRLNQRIGRAIDGNEKYAEAFEGVGVALTDTEGKTRDTESVMRDTIDALQSIEDPAQRSAAASEIFGTKMARDLMPALEDGSLSLEEATAAMDGHGRMTEEQIAKSVEFTDAWDNIKTAAMGMLRQGLTPVMSFLSDRVFPIIQDRVIPAIRDLADWLGPQLQEAASGLRDLFETHVLPVLERLSDWWNENGPAIIARAQEMWAGLQEVFAAVVEGFQTVVGWFSSGSGETSELMEQLRDTFEVVWEAITLVVGKAVEDIREALAAFTSWAARMWIKYGDNIMQHARNVWDLIKAIIGGALDVIKGVFDVFIGLFTGDWRRAWEGVKTIFSGVWQVIRGIFEFVIATITNILDVAMSFISDLWASTWNRIEEWMAETVTTLVATFLDLRNRVEDTIDELVQKAVGFFTDLYDRFKEIASDIFSSVTNTFIRMQESVEETIESLIEFVFGIKDTVVEFFSDAGTWLLEAGRNIIDGLIEGIRNAMGGIGDAMGDVGSTIRRFLPGSPVKEGPLTVLNNGRAGRSIVDMIAGGIDSNAGRVDASMHRSLALSGAGGGSTVVLMVDGKRLGEAVMSQATDTIRLVAGPA